VIANSSNSNIVFSDNAASNLTIRDSAQIKLRCYNNTNLNVSITSQASGNLTFFDNSNAYVYIT
jgi:spore coat protein U-like protein